MSAPRLVLVDAEGLRPFVPALRRLEAEIDYPIEDGADRFVIDHGPEYHPFFSALGDARFLVAVDPLGEVCGVFAGVLRHAILRGRRVRSAYACDLKLAKSHRGAGLARRMLARALGEVIVRPDLRKWRIAYAAAMRGARGDVFRSVRGLHAGKLARPLARLHVYFAEPSVLASLPDGAPPTPRSEEGYDLSPAPTEAEIALTPIRGLAKPGPESLVTTRGRKDMRLRSTNAPWSLVHVTGGPSTWTPTLAHHLRRAGAAIEPGSRACFALDERLESHVAWLSRAGVEPGATCTVYGLVLPGAPRDPSWVHLATSEI